MSFCGSTKPLHINRGQWLPCRGQGMVILHSFPSPLRKLFRRSWVQTRDQESFFLHKFQSNLSSDDFHALANFPILLPFFTIRLALILHYFFHLPLESLANFVMFAKVLRAIIPIKSVRCITRSSFG